MGRVVSEQPDEPLSFLAYLLERKSRKMVWFSVVYVCLYLCLSVYVGIGVPLCVSVKIYVSVYLARKRKHLNSRQKIQ